MIRGRVNGESAHPLVVVERPARGAGAGAEPLAPRSTSAPQGRTCPSNSGGNGSPAQRVRKGRRHGRRERVSGSPTSSTRTGNAWSERRLSSVVILQTPRTWPRQIDKQDAHVTAVQATILTDTVDGNVAACPTPSLRVQLTGSFPNVVMSGMTSPPGSGSSETDDSVTSLSVTMDPSTGAICQVGVSTWGEDTVELRDTPKGLIKREPLIWLVGSPRTAAGHASHHSSSSENVGEYSPRSLHLSC